MRGDGGGFSIQKELLLTLCGISFTKREVIAAWCIGEGKRKRRGGGTGRTQGVYQPRKDHI